MRAEPVSVIVLAKDDADHLRETIERALAELRSGDELVIVDGGSSDATVSIAERFAYERPGVVRARAFPAETDPLEARDAGVETARHDVLAFLSADARPVPGWLDELRAAIGNADVVYGRQRHAPTRRNAPTIARGLRYHRFERSSDALPETYASNVNAAYRRLAFETLASEPDLPSLDEAAFARLARYAGLRIAYAKRAVVERSDPATWGREWRARMLEGDVHAQRRDLLGTPKRHLVWALLVGLLGVATVALGSGWLLAATLLLFFLPTLGRLASPLARRYPPLDLAAGAAVSPFFDLAFVGGYVGRRVARWR